MSDHLALCVGIDVNISVNHSYEFTILTM